MRAPGGYTLIELLAVLAVMAVLAVVAVPAAAYVERRALASNGGVRLALVLRTAQALAQEAGKSVQVVVAGDGAYEVYEPGSVVSVAMRGKLGTGVSGNFPGGAVAFSPSGHPCLPGSDVPRAGSFMVGGESGSVVVLQLGGCVRCR